MEENKDKIREINKGISEALAEWQNIMNLADADEWAYYLNYTDEDLLNAMYIFHHVAQNKAIKSGFYINEEDAAMKGKNYSIAIKECFGFDTVELSNKILSNGNTKV